MQKIFGLITGLSDHTIDSATVITSVALGETITNEHVKRIRPGYGLPPKYLNKIIGQKSKSGITKGSEVTNELIII